MVAPDRTVNTEFYKAVAQVLPVLLLVFVVEWRREFHARTDPASGRLLTVGVTAALVFAGWQTFKVLVYDDPARASLRGVVGCLGGTVAALLVSLLMPPPAEKKP
jgi:hypothetical protein